MLPLNTAPVWGVDGSNIAGVEDALGTDGVTVTDGAVTVLGAIGANNANNAYASNLVVANRDGSVLERLEYLIAAVITERAVEKSDGAVVTPTDDLFVVTGGPIEIIEFVGVVETIIGAGPVTCQIQGAVATPAGTVNFSTAVAIETDAAGTTYTFTAAAPGVLTPTTAGGLANVPSTKWLMPIGTIKGAFSANATGAIKWYMVYRPLSPNSAVAAAA